MRRASEIVGLLLLVGAIFLVYLTFPFSATREEVETASSVPHFPAQSREDFFIGEHDADIERRTELEKEHEIARVRQEKERIRFGADSVEHDSERGVITLRGHAWWRLDDFILGGQHDSNSIIVLDSETYSPLEMEGDIERITLFQ